MFVKNAIRKSIIRHSVNGKPCTSRGVSTVLEGVTPRPLTKGSMAWRFLPYELYSVQRYLQYDTLAQNGLQHFDSWASTFGETVTALELAPEGYTLVGR